MSMEEKFGAEKQIWKQARDEYSICLGKSVKHWTAREIDNPYKDQKLHLMHAGEII